MTYTVKAFNPSTESENRIHADDVAQAYGFRGGLVPGVTLWAYMVHPAVERHGPAFLDRGSMQLRFSQPVYDGDLIECVAGAVAAGGSSPLELRRGDDICVSGWAAVSDTAPAAFAPNDVPEAALPAERAPADEVTLAPGTVLGSLHATFRADRAGEFLDMISDTEPVYAADGVAHPGWLVWKANTVLVANVVLGPWVHVESTARHHGRVRDGDVVVTRARVADRFERKGHQFVDLSVLHTVRGRPVMSIDHRAIYALRPS